MTPRTYLNLVDVTAVPDRRFAGELSVEGRNDCPLNHRLGLDRHGGPSQVGDSSSSEGRWLESVTAWYLPVMKPARRRATYQDVLDAPEHIVAEIVDGELYTSPRPRSPHALAGSSINQDLGPFSRRPGSPARPGGWWILYEPELHLGDDILVPDLAGWRHERLPRVPNVAYFELIPDWACEIVSPSTGRLDRVRKMPIYAREGLQHFWIVDPTSRTVEVYRLERANWAHVTTYCDQDVVRIEPFEALELDLSRWWIDS